MGTMKETPIQNCIFIDSDGNRIDRTAKIMDISLDPIKIPETVGEVRSLNTTGALELTLEDPKFSFRGLVRMLGFRIALRFKLRQIFRRRKEHADE